MRAIAAGEQAIGEISDRTGLNSSKASFYLSVLRDTGFVMRDVPITKRGTASRRGRYFVTDPYLRFFYRFLFAHQAKLALGQIQPILDQIQEQMPDFIQANTWQEMCQDWVLLASAQGEIPVPVEEVGSEWAKHYVIDVVGLSEVDKSLVLGDCYWTDEPLGPEAVVELVKKMAHIVSKKGRWSVYYVLFSAAGWTAEACQEAEKVIQEMRSDRRKRWQVAGIRLLNLDEVDADLVRFSL
jgi:AAA+ ATPase superfamily predicted ATPase